MSTTIVHPNPKDERVAVLERLLSQLGQKVSFVANLDQVRIASGPSGPDSRSVVIVPDDRSDPMSAEAAIRFAEGRFVFVLYVADTMSVEAYKRLVRTGFGEWITWEALPREVVEVFRHVDAAQRSSGSAESATIISFLPSKGGVGNTTLAIEAAVYLAARKKALRGRIAVVDLNFQGSTLGDALDVESRFDVTEILNRPERLDAQLIDIFSSRHPSTVDVFSTPARYGQADEIRPEVIFAILDQLARKYAIVVLDLPAHWQPWIDNLLQGSSAVAIIGETNVPGIRQIAYRLKHLETLDVPESRSAVIINRCETGLFGRVVRKAEIERALSGRRVFYVKRDSNLAAEAANTGRPMIEISSRRAISKNVRRIGDWIESVRKAGQP